MKRILIVLACLVAIPAQAQIVQPPLAVTRITTADQAPAGFVRSEFHGAVIQAAQKLQAEGKITRGQLWNLRFRMLSPSFRAKAEQLATFELQVWSADEANELPESVQVGTDGQIVSIDWDGLINFIERLIPIILQLIQIFGGG